MFIVPSSAFIYSISILGFELELSIVTVLYGVFINPSVPVIVPPFIFISTSSLGVFPCEVILFTSVVVSASFIPINAL